MIISLFLFVGIFWIWLLIVGYITLPAIIFGRRGCRRSGRDHFQKRTSGNPWVKRYDVPLGPFWWTTDVAMLHSRVHNTVVVSASNSCMYLPFCCGIDFLMPMIFAWPKAHIIIFFVFSRFLVRYHDIPWWYSMIVIVPFSNTAIAPRLWKYVFSIGMPWFIWFLPLFHHCFAIKINVLINIVASFLWLFCHFYSHNSQRVLPLFDHCCSAVAPLVCYSISFVIPLWHHDNYCTIVVSVTGHSYVMFNNYTENMDCFTFSIIGYTNHWYHHLYQPVVSLLQQYCRIL